MKNPFDILFIDWDDTISIGSNSNLNPSAIELIHLCLTLKIRVAIVTLNLWDPIEFPKSDQVDVFRVGENSPPGEFSVIESKSDVINRIKKIEEKAIFIDDYMGERADVRKNVENIVVLDVPEIPWLIQKIKKK